jgi:hypothetical protein
MKKIYLLRNISFLLNNIKTYLISMKKIELKTSNKLEMYFF